MRKRLLLCAGAVVMFASCGGSDSGGGTTTPSQTAAATITISSGGLSPKTVTVPRGSQVQFVNNDNRSHQMSSDPHPDHTNCPELNQVGFLNAGHSRQTGNLNTARTCGFHDHDSPNTVPLQGSIVIQ
jgi:plastocyanin